MNDCYRRSLLIILFTAIAFSQTSAAQITIVAEDFSSQIGQSSTVATYTSEDTAELQPIVDATGENQTYDFRDASISDTLQGVVSYHSNPDNLPSGEVFLFLFSGGGGNVMRAALDGSDPERVLGDMAFPEGPLVVVGGGAGTSTETHAGLATALSLVDAYPNPFRDEAHVIVSVDRAVPVQMELVDVQGRRVARINHGVLKPGRHALRLTADVPSGVYLVRLNGASTGSTKMLVRIR